MRLWNKLQKKHWQKSISQEKTIRLAPRVQTPWKTMYFIFAVISSHFVAIVFLGMPNGLIWNQLLVSISLHFCTLWTQTSFKFPPDRATQRLKRKSGIVAVASNCDEKEVLTSIASAFGREPGVRLKGTSGWTGGKSIGITPHLASVEANMWKLNALHPIVSLFYCAQWNPYTFCLWRDQWSIWNASANEQLVLFLHAIQYTFQCH